jgi:hypothetical protein
MAHPGGRRIEGKKIDHPGEFHKCLKCGEKWPATEEFFYAQKKNGYYTFSSPCIACQAESRLKLAGKPCIEPGCTETRLSHRRPRCRKHEREYFERRKALSSSTVKAVSGD